MLHRLIEPKQKGETKFIFFSGKGGVGKSTMSCATAVWLAEKGYKTLLVTTDPAPNLSDIFGQEIGHKITSLDWIENLFAIEINPDVASEEYRERIIAPMRELFDEKNLQVIKEQINSPCVEEVAAFDKFIEFMDDPQYDVVIFDTAPTGHTIRLLELSQSWSTEIEKGGSTCIGPSASLQGAKSRYEKAISYLQDKIMTSFIFVLKPENSSILETKRSLEELSKLGIKTSFLIINGVLPEEVCTDEFFKKRKSGENKIIAKINNEFKGIQRSFYPLRDSEVSGSSLLKAVGEFLYEDKKQVFETELSDEKLVEKTQLRNNLKVINNLFTPSNGTRYIFFTGKGGVGKSTIACTTSLYLAEKGFKTLIVTTDPASHLHDIFEQEIEHEPTKINGVDNLFAARIDQKKALAEYKKSILDAVEDKDEETKKSVEEDLSSPCAEEMAVFEKFMSYFELHSYEIIIFDTAPTGHTLRLLELPSDWKEFIDLGTLTKKTTSDKTKRKYSNIIETMQNTEKSTFVFVMYPEYTPIIEAWRASEDLKSQVGIETALVAVNYILPKNYGRNKFFDNRRKQEEKYLHEIKQRFKTPLLLVPLLEHEPKGLDNLVHLKRNILGKTQRTEIGAQSAEEIPRKESEYSAMDILGI